MERNPLKAVFSAQHLFKESSVFSKSRMFFVIHLCSLGFKEQLYTQAHKNLAKLVV